MQSSVLIYYDTPYRHGWSWTCTDAGQWFGWTGSVGWLTV